MPAKHAIKILYGESDEQVQSTQAAEMKKAGHHVTTALGRQGSTLSKDDRHHLPYMVKKSHEGTKVLVMHAASRHHEVDAHIEANTSMQFVLEKIAKLMSEQAVSV